MSRRKNGSRAADTWLVEIISIFFSMLSLLAILILLTVYDGKLLFRWYRASLNAMISVFATISRMLLAVAVSSSLGRWRWNWFAKRRHPLEDFESMDTASRGAWGRVQLLWMTKSS
jgi:hypothetical protein